MKTSTLPRTCGVAAVLLLTGAHSGCAVVAIAGAATSAVVTVGSAAVSVGATVVGTTVKVAGKAVGATVDAVTPSAAPSPK